MSGLFGTLNIAKRGMSVEQKSIQITSHNIANANTEGYSRQRAIRETTRPFPMPSVNNSIGPGQIGTGVQITTIQRVRDNFLDFQFRAEQSKMGTYEARDRFLSEIEDVFNEPSDTGIATLIDNFFNSWQELSKQAETSNSRTVVSKQSNVLTNQLNHTFSQLETIKSDTQMVIKDSIFQINSYLDQISKLNQQIMTTKISHEEPNDLMDKRDLLLDKLSSEFNIQIDNDSFEAIKLKPYNIQNLPDLKKEITNGLLVRREPKGEVNRFSYINNVTIKKDQNQKTLNINYLKLGDTNKPSGNNSIKIDVTSFSDAQIKDIKRHIEECRVIWSNKDGDALATENLIVVKDKDGKVDFNDLDKKLGLFIPNDGSLKGYMTVQHDVDKYEDQLNRLAKAIAYSVNAVHMQGDYDNGTPFFINKNNEKSDKISDKIKDIDASNIKVNPDIMNDIMKIQAGLNSESGTTDGKRALAIAQLRNALTKIQDIDLNNMNIEEFINKCTGNQGLVPDKVLGGILTIKNNNGGMTIDNYFKDTVDTLGIDESEALRIIKNEQKLLNNFNQKRTSISGVSIDEEMSNLIEYQHSYAANAKIISTIDQLLDVVVNGLKR